MSDERTPSNIEPDDAPNEYVRGGKGRRDEVGGSGIYPASMPDAPADAEIVTPGELVHHESPPAGTGATGQDDNLIGAERLPRKGDDENS